MRGEAASYRMMTRLVMMVMTSLLGMLRRVCKMTTTLLVLLSRRRRRGRMRRRVRVMPMVMLILTSHTPSIYIPVLRERERVVPCN